MSRPIRVLVVSFLPPAEGGIAAWTGILRDRPRDDRFDFAFESLWPAGRATATRRLLHAIRLPGRVAWMLRSRTSDVLHLECCLSPLGLWRDLAVAAAARVSGAPVLVHYCGSLPDVLPRLPAPSRLVLRLLARTANINAVMTSSSAAFIEGLPRAGRAILAGALVEDELPERRRVDAVAEGPLRVVYAGRLSREKGIPELLAAARAVPEVRFTLVGRADTDGLEALRAAAPNVSAVGHLPRARVVDRLLESDAFVFPSRREGSPLAVAEAMAAGLPVIATRVGGVPELVEDGVGGWLVPAGDPQPLAAALSRLAGDRSLARRMGAHNRAVARKRLAFSRAFVPLAAAYEHLAGERL
jgi:glycosyltransferase involved in cell wall biosynthesis